MPRRVLIIQQQEIFRRLFFRIIEARLRYERFDGQLSDEVVRLKLERGDGVAVVLHAPTDDAVLLVEQFRYPAHEHGNGWLLELPAGIVEPGEDPEATMRREIVEETGYRAQTIAQVATFFLSPGGASERIFLYYATFDPAERQGNGGGVLAEGEDLRLHSVTLDTALGMITTGAITDAKTIIGLQWLALRRKA